MNRKYRKTVIAGNWKMNKTPTETKEYMAQLKALMFDNKENKEYEQKVS